MRNILRCLLAATCAAFTGLVAPALVAAPYALYYNPGNVLVGSSSWTQIDNGRVDTVTGRIYGGTTSIRAQSWRDKPDSFFKPGASSSHFHSEVHKVGVAVNFDTRWFGMAVNFEGARRTASRTFAQWMDDQGWHPAVMISIVPAAGQQADANATHWRLVLKVIRNQGDEVVLNIVSGTTAQMYDVWHRLAVKTKFSTGTDGYVQVYYAAPNRGYQLVNLDNGFTYRGRTFRNVSGNGKIRFQGGQYAHWSPAATWNDHVRSWIDEIRIADGAHTLGDVAP